MARHVCSTCGRTLSRMDFVRHRAHRTEQGYYCHACFSSMLSDVAEQSGGSSRELEEDRGLLEALEESLPEDGLPKVDDGPVDPGAETLTAPVPERSIRPSDSTVQSVKEELGVDREKEAALAKKPKAGRAKPKRPRDATPGSGRSADYVIAALLTAFLLVVTWLILTWGN